jgi:chemotaxis protein methyltransferase CheR
MPAQDRERYFIGVDKERWQVRPEFRSAVRFERHNLLSLLDGTSPLEFADFDLILCRNVLIYFHPDTVVQLVGALRDRLADDGWMLLGHAEPNPAFSSMMQIVNLPGTVAYRRDLEAPPPPLTQIPAVLPEWKPRLPAPKPAAPLKTPAPAHPQRTPAKAPPVPDDADALLGEIRARADSGDFATADRLCRKALADRPLDPVMHFYRGLVLRELRRSDEAEKSFLNSLYLDKSFAMAHYHLGLLLLAEGRTGPGRRSLTNAARIAAAMPGDRLLEEADGLTAKDLRDLVRVHLAAKTPAGRRG